MASVSIRFDAPAEVVFDYVADPANRPAWQSSLARVEDVSGPVAVGQTWLDVTRLGLRPRMRTTRLERPRVWSETGTWRGFTADLTLYVVPSTDGTTCTVTASAGLRGRGWTALPARLLSLVAPLAIRADLLRAVRQLRCGPGCP